MPAYYECKREFYESLAKASIEKWSNHFVANGVWASDYRTHKHVRGIIHNTKQYLKKYHPKVVAVKVVLYILKQEMHVIKKEIKIKNE